MLRQKCYNVPIIITNGGGRVTTKINIVTPVTEPMPLTSNMSASDIVNLLHLKEGGSRGNYYTTLTDFLSVTGLDSFLHVSKKEALLYSRVLDERVAAGSFKKSTRNVYLKRLKSMFDALGVTSVSNPFMYIIINEVDMEYKGAKIEPEYFSDLYPTLPDNIRPAVRLAVECGLSLAEIHALRTVDVLGFGEFIVVNNASNRRVIRIPSDLLTELKYLASISPDKMCLFFTSRELPASMRWLQRTLGKYSSYSFQDFRIYAFLHMLKNGMTNKQWVQYTGMNRHYEDYAKHLYYTTESAFSYNHALL